MDSGLLINVEHEIILNSHLLAYKMNQSYVNSSSYCDVDIIHRAGIMLAYRNGGSSTELCCVCCALSEKSLCDACWRRRKPSQLMHTNNGVIEIDFVIGGKIYYWHLNRIYCATYHNLFGYDETLQSLLNHMHTDNKNNICMLCSLNSSLSACVRCKRSVDIVIAKYINIMMLLRHCALPLELVSVIIVLLRRSSQRVTLLPFSIVGPIINL